MSYDEFVKRTLTIFVLVIFALIVWQLRGVLMLAILAIIIAVSLTIPVNRLQRFGIRRPFAIFITLTVIFTLTLLFITWILPPLVTEMGTLIAEFPDAYENVLDSYLAWYEGQDSTIRNVLPSFDNESINQLTSEITGYISPIVTQVGNALLAGMTNILIVIVVSIFLLLDPMDLIQGFIALIPPAYRERSLSLMVELKLTVTTWMTALTFSISITTFLVWLIMGVVLSVPNGLAIGVIAGVMTIIPNVGSVIPVIPIVIFTLADDPTKLPLVIPAYLIIQLTESNILTPAIVRRQLNIPAALILLFQLIAATLFGFIGILLAVPMLAIIITLTRELYVYDILGQRGKAVEIRADEQGKIRLIERETRRNTSLVTEIRRTGLMQTIHIPEFDEDDTPRSDPKDDY